jgi:hypothetical protein
VRRLARVLYHRTNLQRGCVYKCDYCANELDTRSEGVRKSISPTGRLTLLCREIEGSCERATQNEFEREQGCAEVKRGQLPIIVGWIYHRLAHAQQGLNSLEDFSFGGALADRRIERIRKKSVVN